MIENRICCSAAALLLTTVAAVSQTPPARPTPKAPSPGQAASAPASPAAEPGRPAHSLEGIWKIYWIDENKASEMRVGQVSVAQNVTTLVGSMATLQGEACPLTGTVLDALTGTFLDGLETKTQQISAYVVLRAQCPSRQIWIEGFGLPKGRVLISGRATSIDAGGARAYFAVGLGR